MLLSSTIVSAQISPGDLSQSHADLEGMSNCTLCHDLGEKVSNKKCLDCHDDIQSLLNASKGYHSDLSVKNKDCFECHSDHHGRKFDMVRFDEDNFNHNKTGYELEGKHEVIDCRECHVSDFIEDKEIKKRKNTFLGLDDECLACHDDFHQNTLSETDCLACHDLEAFKPAPRFDHDEADFVLKEKHIEVDCVECHEMSTKNGMEFQNFSNVAFEDCKSCHEDPHQNKIQGKCIQCHNETSFSTFIGKGRFNHSVSGFDLKGKHTSIDCFACHKETSDPLLVFQDKSNTEESNCIACHTDQHEGKYDLNCAKCHNEKSFLSLNNMDFFDHSIPDYHLEGKHLEVDCKECHVGRFSAPLEYASCNSCHDDYHRGEFTKNEVTPDCIECHSLENGFDYSLFTIEQHQKSAFVLDGAHVATPCFACHIDEREDRWTFVDLGVNCKDCHEDEHNASLDATYFNNEPYKCSICHVNDAWSVINFDHDFTEWPLDGKHVDVACKECHFDITAENTLSNVEFKSLDGQCMSCHENIHDETFAIDGVTDCNRCHVTDSWYPKKFDHNSTAFPLDGKHKEVACKECHESVDDDGQIVIVYKTGKLECIDCH